MGSRPRGGCGEIDAIFDEGVVMWADQVTAAGAQFLPLSPDHLEVLAAQVIDVLWMSRRCREETPRAPSSAGGRADGSDIVRAADQPEP